MLHGVDLSHHNVPFQLSGYDFAIIRAGYGKRAFSDRSFEQHMAQAMEAKLNIGCYWFIYARNADEAEQNALAFIETVAKFKDRINLPLYSDFEYDSELKFNNELKFTGELRTDIVNKFNSVVAENGYKFGTYTNVDYLKTKFTSKLVIGSLWLAQWGDKYDPHYSPDIWQYTNILHHPDGTRLDGNYLINYTLIDNDTNTKIIFNRTFKCPNCNREFDITLKEV